MVSHVRVLGAWMVLVSVTAAGGQEERRIRSLYFDCPYVNYFDADCPQVCKAPARQEGPGPGGRGGYADGAGHLGAEGDVGNGRRQGARP